MRQRTTKKASGLATVEMAFVTPVLLILMLITAEYTRAFYEFNTLTKSVRDAARFLSLDGFNGSIFELGAAEIAAARNLATYGNLTGSGPPLLDNLTTADFDVDEILLGSGIQQEHIRVSVDYSFQPLWPVIPAIGFLNSSVDNRGLILSASSTMRAQQ